MHPPPLAIATDQMQPPQPPPSVRADAARLKQRCAGVFVSEACRDSESASCGGIEVALVNVERLVYGMFVTNQIDHALFSVLPGRELLQVRSRRDRRELPHVD